MKASEFRKLMRKQVANFLREEAIPGDAPSDKQVHVFDFDDTLGLTSNANGIMLYKDGKPAHKTEGEAREWMKSVGVKDSDLLDPGVKQIPERDNGYAIYVNSSALARVQAKYPVQGVTGVKEVPNEGEAIMIDFTPSAGTDPDTTKPIKSTISKLKQANSQGSDTIVITARSATGKGKDFAGNDINATNAEDMQKFLSAQGAAPTKGVMGVSGQNKGDAIINKFMKGDDAPEEIHFYDDLKKNTDQVKGAIADKVPAELFIYGPGEFAHGEADPNKPDEKFAKAVKETLARYLRKEYGNQPTISKTKLKEITKQIVAEYKKRAMKESKLREAVRKQIRQRLVEVEGAVDTGTYSVLFNNQKRTMDSFVKLANLGSKSPEEVAKALKAEFDKNTTTKSVIHKLDDNTYFIETKDPKISKSALIGRADKPLSTVASTIDVSTMHTLKKDMGLTDDKIGFDKFWTFTKRATNMMGDSNVRKQAGEVASKLYAAAMSKITDKTALKESKLRQIIREEIRKALMEGETQIDIQSDEMAIIEKNAELIKKIQEKGLEVVKKPSTLTKKNIGQYTLTKDGKPLIHFDKVETQNANRWFYRVSGDGALKNEPVKQIPAKPEDWENQLPKAIAELIKYLDGAAV